MRIETLEGNLRDTYKQLEPDSMRSALHLMRERRLHPDDDIRADLRENFFYTSDGIIYFVESGEPKVCITPRSHNLVLKHLDEAVHQFFTNENYFPAAAEIKEAIHARDSKVLDLNQLRLQKYTDETSYLIVSTVNYGRLNPIERRLVGGVFSDGIALVENMKMLRDNGITETQIYLLNPAYVCKHAKAGAIARVSSLSNFNDSSCFSAADRYPLEIGHIRGVLRTITEQETSPSTVPENTISLVPERSDPNQSLTQSVHDQKSLEWARKLLDGTAGGTVLDY